MSIAIFAWMIGVSEDNQKQWILDFLHREKLSSNDKARMNHGMQLK